MRITKAEWNRYKNTMSQLSDKASKEFSDWVNQNGGWETVDRQLMAEVAWSIASKYSEGSSALAAQMYDAIAQAEGVNVQSAEMAADVDFGELAKAINGALKHSTDDDFCSSPVGRSVKQAGADTMLKNASRDRAEFAWIPSGDSCAFCLVLASNGWQRASKRTIAGDHAKHIHTHCDCQFAIRFNKNTQVDGYNPDEYLEMYKNAEGKTSEQKIKSMRKALEDSAKAINDNKPVAIPKATNREEASNIIKSLFGSMEQNTKNINDELLIENVNRLTELNARFKILSGENRGYFTASPSGSAMAWTSSSFQDKGKRVNLSLVGRWFKNTKDLVDSEKIARETFFSMPFTDEYLKTYTITHEYGHMIEAYVCSSRTDFDALNIKFASLSPEAKRGRYRQTEKSEARKITDEIVAIAKSKNPNFSMKENLSKYGHTNSFEFFAECFANSQCGSPNELGLAMQEWLEKEGF